MKRQIEGWPDRTIKIGSELHEQERKQLVSFLQENADVFTWSPADMMGVDPKVAQHRLVFTISTPESR